MEIILEDDMVNVDNSCHFPIFPADTPEDSQAMEDKTWYLGHVFMKKFFTLLDHRPEQQAVEQFYVDGNLNTDVLNQLGVAPCERHRRRLHEVYEDADPSAWDKPTEPTKDGGDNDEPSKEGGDTDPGIDPSIKPEKNDQTDE